MANPITLCTSQWVDIPLKQLVEKAADWGLDGLELSCGGDHFNVSQALEDENYLEEKRELLNISNINCWAIANHLVGQCVCDLIDERHKSILYPDVWGDGDPEGVRQRAAEEMKRAATAAKLFGIDVVTGFTGSSIWHLLYAFPPTRMSMIDAGYEDFARRWLPIFNHFEKEGVKFALEVHPTEIAYDIYTMQRALEAVDYHPAFGINFDPSHLVHQMIDPVEFINAFPDRIFHVHIKDSRVNLNGRNSILASHLAFGDYRRGWDFVSPGRGDIQWDLVVRALNRIGYRGPYSVEWEDSGMDREWGVVDALRMVRENNFSPSDHAFDSVFAKDN
jgi:sugar phosphate isomerase/epimerase